MTNTMTPMKRLNFNIKTLKQNVENVFKDFTLNKSAPKLYFEWGGEQIETKGVQSDFVNVFKSLANNMSFAISYSYIDLPVEEHKITVSLKTTDNNNDIQNSLPMSIEEFKAKINYLNKDLIENTNNVNTMYVLQKVSSIFLNEDLNLFVGVQKVEQELKDYIQQKREDYSIEALEKSKKSIDTTLLNVKQVIKEELANSVEQKRINTIMKELERLTQAQKNKSRELEDQYQLHTWAGKSYENEKKLKENKILLEQDIKNYIQNRKEQSQNKKVKYN